ncbi:related to leucine permease transcriptional regulator [Cephalotrichum gorgonifer]|uniref:Related to leucine permease transcriptional regulator n=1 Tax=Cephalotrichum gorgonifer TaxID=2041049 RepID=A0AAE8MUM7_9PEZI|nr:related to leucine permease transcriptional regulator [Cephalotrichum gorgonifer]
MPGWQAATLPTSSHSSATTTTHYGYPSNPAYVPVQVQQTFGQPVSQPAAHYAYAPPSQQAQVAPTPPPVATPSTASAQSTPQPQSSRIEWPASVRSYVQRTFLERNHDPSIQKSELEAKLKEVITHAKDSGQLYGLDWDNMPLPQALIREQREAELRRHASIVSSPATPATSAPRSTFDSTSKKRKSSEPLVDNRSSPPPPWRSTNQHRTPLEDRISYRTTEKRPSMDEALPKLSKFQKQQEKRRNRFEGGYTTYRSPSPPPADGPVVGTSTTLEKRYLRLTAPPVASNVRPEHILRQTLDLLKKKWRKESNYSYICDQFKSMRQDLTVQRVKNEFTVSVYEIHARIALEKGDLGEYNQCQTQLRSLYQLGLKGNPIEFKAYRILYFIHTANSTGLVEAIADLTPAEKRSPALKHALDVRSAIVQGNYHRFFQLYLDTPNMGAYLMDMFVTRERLAALCNICKAYKPDVRLRFITEELGFESDADAAQFVVDHNGQHLLEDRGDSIFFLSGKAGALFEGPRAAAFQRVDIKGQI